ncbi:ATP-dependent protease subunit HslV [candidate division KSB1 bacterium]|nr:ATP-dependent protease subunit HslV [candidate division KSB1 bacterium]NIR68821.1 ATP-dependent protease subunit HslV [candidate division KSB1 bacterium]NIS27184.1 ATP-dependent protease subunit HslV [candidate division KSB1 bacterium]NIT74069.1 ATP-dependent protease subunit HslV [candidate division KSB1 bacterium]NIU26934.1 ATP-dependent protease subunit HslV [candidate division KSB1 bacterium]
MHKTRSTTILAVRHKGQSAMGGDGQVSFGDSVLKMKAKKIRKIYNNSVLTGFAGASADAFTLFEKFEKRLEQYSGNLSRAAVELAKEWRTDRFLRRLEAQLIVMDAESMFLISGTGDVIEPDENTVAIGSGGSYAMAAASALMRFSDLDARAIVEESLKIAANICIYTNTNLTIEQI